MFSRWILHFWFQLDWWLAVWRNEYWDSDVFFFFHLFFKFFAKIIGNFCDGILSLRQTIQHINRHLGTFNSLCSLINPLLKRTYHLQFCKRGD
ncbi:MAG: hypothetical protein DWH74_00270 [Planctomycetota bacterium]|nr:MAG: hypothetical protein DWH74_00270 [Planctomycetota bacterium]